MPTTTVTAAVIPAFGRPPEAMAMPTPQAGPGRSVVRLRAAGVNPVDLAIGAGRFYMALPDPPFIAGVEAVGEVVESDAHRVGSLVWCLQPTAGCWAELFSASDQALHPVRDDADPALAVAMGVAGLAGWMPVTDRGELRPGETVVVLGATGAVGHVALQAARAAGAGRVVAVGRDADALGRLRSQGADAVVVVRDDMAASLAAACPDGIDLVIDALWGAPLLACIGAMNARARVVQVGSAAAQTAEIPGGALRGRRIDIRGFSVFAEAPDALGAAHAALMDAAMGGQVGVPVQRTPLTQVGDAWARQAAGAGGSKLVLVP